MTNAEIQVGEYVRTVDGYIRKITQINEKESYEGFCYGACKVDKKYKGSAGISAKKIKKHDFNITKLIEAGDYVNGDKVELSRDKALYVACNYLGGIGVRTLESYYTYVEDMKEEDIETIVTHEQFKNMEYKVGGAND